MRQVADFPAEEVFAPALDPVRRPAVLRPLAVAAALLAIGYFASPYVVLYRLSRAVRAGDFAALTDAIDWPKMQGAMRQSIENGIAGESVSKPDDDDLPPFGSGFLSGMADRVVADEVTPVRLSTRLAAFEAGAPGHTGGGGFAAGPHVTMADARFVGLTRFMVALNLPNAAPADPPLRIDMHFVHGRWRIVGADMPPTLLAALEAQSAH